MSVVWLSDCYNATDLLVDKQFLQHTTTKDPVPDVHASPWRDMEKIEAEKVMPAAAAVRRRVEDDGAPSVSVGGTARQADAG